MRILIAEDDPILTDGLSRSLRQAGYAVDCVKTGVEADSAVAGGEFDLLILDLGLPKMGGLEVLRRMRARQSQVPVLILTALYGVIDRVRGLDLGADDYLSKPFALDELNARVRALTRRGHSGSSNFLRHGDLVYDQVGKVAEIRGKTIELSAREIGLLEMLLRRYANGARRSAPMPSKSTCTGCAGSSKRVASRSLPCAAWATASPSRKTPEPYADMHPHPTSPSAKIVDCFESLFESLFVG